MTDMGPRRMDGFAGGRPAAAPQGAPRSQQPQPQPRVRPVAPAPRRPQSVMRPAQQPQPMVQPQGYAQAPQPQQRPMPAQVAPKPPKKQGGVWRLVLQFIIGLAVIAGVAAAIVALYVRYYQ